MPASALASLAEPRDLSKELSDGPTAAKLRPLSEVINKAEGHLIVRIPPDVSGPGQL